jgi:putative transport protein
VPQPSIVLQAGDVVVVSGRRDVLVETLGNAASSEIEDRELLDIPVASYDIYVTSKAVIGHTLQDVAKKVGEVRSVFLRDIVRGGVSIPIAPNTTIERGDVLRVTGTEPAVLRAKDRLGTVVVGYANSVRPIFGRIPDAAASFMIALGLAAFVAMIGIGAGPHFVDALRDAGIGLFLGGVIVTMVPLFFGLYFGRYVLKLNPLLLLGGIAGAQTMTAAMAAVQERSRSSVAVLGYSGTVALGHILLTTWGTVIVRLVA